MSAASAHPRPALWPLLVAAGVGLWTLRERWAPTPAAPNAVDAPALATGATPALECPPDQLPDDGVCIPVPPPAERVAETQTRIELLPGRSADYPRYLTPIAAYPAAAPAEGLGVFVAAPRGVPVTAISLEAQTGPTRRWVGATTPARLVTLHRVDRGGSLRTYVLAYDGLAFDTPPGIADVDVGTPLGRVAAAASVPPGAASARTAPRTGLTGLTLTVHQLRRGVNPDELDPNRLLLDDSSLDCDARNVLPIKPAL